MASKTYTFEVTYTGGSHKLSIILTDDYTYLNNNSTIFNSYSDFNRRISTLEALEYAQTKLGLDLNTVWPTLNNIEDALADEYTNALGLCQWQLQDNDEDFMIENMQSRYHLGGTNFELQYVPSGGDSFISAMNSVNKQSRYHDIRATTLVFYATDVNNLSTISLVEHTSGSNHYYECFYLTINVNTSTTNNTQITFSNSTTSLRKEFVDNLIQLNPVINRISVTFNPENSGEATVTQDLENLNNYNIVITNNAGYTYSRSDILTPQGQFLYLTIDTEFTVETDPDIDGPYQVKVYMKTTDSQDQGGTSKPDPGDKGHFDDTSDDINIPNLPTALVVDSGFVTIFNPSLTQVKDIAHYLWTANVTDVEFWKRIVANPMDLILGFSIVPVAIDNGGPKRVKLGGIDTGLDVNIAASQYVELNCGTISIQNYWGSALDYSPYTKLTLYLPYVGFEELDIDSFMGKDLGVVYHIDILSGSLICYVTADGSVLHTYLGHCAQEIPLSSVDFSSMISAAINVTTSSVGAAASAAGGNVAAAANGLASAAQNVMGMKPNYRRSGSLGGPASQLSIQKPYIVIQRPRQSLAENYKAFVGYPSNITSRISSLSGFTKVEEIHLVNIDCLDEERSEIETILKEGFII